MSDAPFPADPNLPVVIVGAGHGGATAAATLRQFGHAGPVTLIGAETAIPYHRPPLSKAYLKDEATAESLALKPEAFYAGKDIDLRLGTKVWEVDAAAKVVKLDDGEALPYGALILATGSRNRTLPCAPDGMAGLHELRSLEDAEKLKSALGPGKTLLIVGGGYIGLEAAASATALGAKAIVVEREPRVLARVASPELSAFFEAYHRARGVEIRTGAGLAGFEMGEDGQVCAARLEDGTKIACDLVLVGVGAGAESALAESAGLTTDHGVVVDMTARTSDPSIFAIGDMTLRPMPHYEERMFRLESVPNALEQARQAAAAITGRPAPRPEAPWFWSDQYDLKLQIAGLPFEADAQIVRGSVADGKFSVFHLKGNRVRAVEAVGAPADFMAGRQMIMQGAAVDPERLADPGTPAKEAVA